MAHSLWHIHGRVHITHIDDMVRLFEDLGFSGISWIECDDAPPSGQDDDNGFPIASEFIIDGYTQNRPDLDFINSLAQTYIPSTVGTISQGINPSFTANLVDNTDWLEACYQNMPAQEIGQFYVYGSHITDTPPAQLISICVNAATAFGSGEHPTTRSCLHALSDTPFPYDAHDNSLTILDMGCGSGILAIGAKKKFPHAHVVAADSDAESVRVTCHNADNNNVTLTCYESTGFSNPVIAQHGPYHIIFANILANPVTALAPDFFSAGHHGGFVIVSGFLERHRDMVTQAYVHAGFSLHNTHISDGWVALTFQKI